MRKTTSWLGVLCLGFLAGCGGGSGGGSAPPGGGNPPPLPLAPAEFTGLSGTAPADLALGQPLTLQWVLPAGASIASVSLEATVQAGPAASRSSCTVNAGPLATNATSATLTIPNVCASKTTKEVVLRLTVESTTGQRSTATRTSC